MIRKWILFLIPVCLLAVLSLDGIAQPTWTLDPFGKEKKPEQYEEKILGSEKTATKKFTTVRRVIQNNVTHYNFYFNANNKLNAVIERAKLSQKDDYSRLLSFYPYSLENTVAQQVELDSVIYKSTGGILLHDLRNDWIDNLYLLIGKAYFLRKEFDSAALTFQFINYNLFPRKKNEDESRVVGGKNDEAPGVFSIADKENRNIIQKAITKAPSRNESLLWLVRTFIEKREFGEAAGLINILENDPNLPKRLHDDLAEVSAYWFYSQGIYDSTAVHLERALSNAENKQDRSRWEYLLGQMYETSGNFDKASEYYGKASKHTADPVMDIYARLNDAKMFREQGNVKEMQESIARLLKMARKDKYTAYRDIIYYSTGQLSVRVPDTTNGIGYYQKSIRYNTQNTDYRNKAFLQLADISYDQRDYKSSANYYDSVSVDDSLLLSQLDYNLAERSASLKKLVTELLIVEKQDSLQMIAAMTPEERDAAIKKIVKDYRKQAGIKTEEDISGTTLITFNDKKDEPLDLFAAPSKGEWYFYNGNLRTRGFSDFKAKWGKRANVDNWRRVSAAPSAADNHGMVPPAIRDSLLKAQAVADADFSYEGLLKNIPLTPAQLDSSNEIVAKSLLAMADIFKFELEDYEQAINIYDVYLQRFPNRLEDGQVYLGMYYAYNKLGNSERANHYKSLLTNQFAQSRSALALTDPAALNPTKKNPEVTRRYEEIYNMFLEGRFAEATEAKKSADSAFGANYWTPQLLYIEAIHLIKERNDSGAIQVLNNISILYPGTPLQARAITMIDVLSRRAEIEAYLSKLEVTRAEEEHIIIASDDAVEKKTVTAPEIKQPAQPSQIIVMKDSAIREIPKASDGLYVLEPDQPHQVIMVLNKVDGVYQNEARNAFIRYNREMFFSSKLSIDRDALDADRTLLVIKPFEDAASALSYYDKIKKAAPTEVSWLPAAKYSFLIISDKNLQTLKAEKNVDAYRSLLNTAYENRF